MELGPEKTPAERLLEAAEGLAEALATVREITRGYTALTIEIVNEALERAGVQIGEIGR